MLEKTRLAAVAWALLVPPDAVIVCRAADHVRLAVAVHVVGEHIGASVAEVCRMESPGLAVIRGRLLPPATRTQHIEPAVAAQVAHAKTVRITKSSGDSMT